MTKDRVTMESSEREIQAEAIAAGWVERYKQSVGPGWDDILRDLFRGVAGIVVWNRETYIDSDYPFAWHQIKEKLGTLRAYASHDGSPFIAEHIAIAEWRSERTCELCGRPGTPRAYGWWQTRCDWHEFVRRVQHRWWRIGGYRLYRLRHWGRRWFCRRGWHVWSDWPGGVSACNRCLVKKGGETEE